MNYKEFLKNKEFLNTHQGFKPVFMPDFLYDFQKALVEWSILKGKSALFEDCGLGKTPQQLVWAENVVRKTNKNVLIIAPLAVSYQTIKEGEKFGIEVKKTQGEKIHKGINITNYERLKNFKPEDFISVVCDESSILKNFDGKMRRFITDFLQKIKYRLLCSATPAPNDFTELGTSSEALGEMSHNQMLGMFFTNDNKHNQQWNMKGHAKKRFWQWLSIWARAIRKPSDLNFDDDGFILPNLNIKQHLIKSNYKYKTLLMTMANTLEEQRTERKNTLQSRCEFAASLVPKNKPCLFWCHLNTEADLLEKLIPNSVQVAGCDEPEVKEERLVGFAKGDFKVLITKPRIAGFGLNWQHCSDVVFFPSHSYEQFYQAIRRCWRFGQKNEVNCNIVASERERPVIHNMLKKEKQANEMYNGIIREMSEFQTGQKKKEIKLISERIPEWL